MSRGNPGSIFARLSTKIFLSVTGLLFLFALVLCLFLYVVMMPQSPGQTLTPQNAILAYQIKSRLHEAQKNESSFLVYPMGGYTEKHKTSVSELLSLASRFTQSATEAGDTKNISVAGQITSAVQELENGFLELVKAREIKGFTPAQGLLHELDAALRQLDKVLLRNEVGGLALALLRLQRFEQDYLDSNKKIDLDNLQEAIKNFTEQLKDTEIDLVDAQMLRKSIKEYQSSLERYQALSLATKDRNLSKSLGNERQRQVEAMAAATGAIGAVINRVNVHDVLPMGAFIRNRTADYLTSGNMEYANQVNQGLDDIIRIYSNASILQDHKAQTLKAVNTYRDLFNSVVSQDAQINKQLAALNAMAETLEAFINEVIKSSPGVMPDNAEPLSLSENKLVMIATFSGLGVLLIGFLAAFLLARSVSRPIDNMTNTIARITADHNLNVQIPIIADNEIGELARELNGLFRLQDTVLNSMQATRPDIPDELLDVENNARDLLTQLQAAGKASENITVSVARQQELGAGAAGSLAQLLASANSVQQGFSTADEHNKRITEAVEQLNASVRPAVEGVNAMIETSSQVSGIIALNTEIAEKTGLLALNASVKAARAGAHGKEFVVIADEIAKLSQRSEEIAREAGQLTAVLAGKAHEAATLGNKTANSLEQFREAVRLNLSLTDELTSQVSNISANGAELDKLAKELTFATGNLDSIAKEQEKECAKALASANDLLAMTSALTGKRQEGQAVRVNAPKKTLDNIAITWDEPEEDESTTSQNTDAETRGADAPHEDTKTSPAKEAPEQLA